MMVHAFDGVDAKVDRAADQLETLIGDFESFTLRRAYTISEEFDRETDEWSAVFHPTEQPPLRWSVILGEVLHDLRSALDQAVYQLTLQHSDRELAGSEFPIFLDEAAYLSQRRGGMFKIRGVSEPAKAAIEGMQPFRAPQRGVEPENTTTWMLHELSKIDKHRTLHLTRRMTSGAEIRLLQSLPLRAWSVPLGVVLEEGSVLCAWRLAPGAQVMGRQMDVVDLSYEIALDENGPAVTHGVSAKDAFLLLIRRTRGMVGDLRAIYDAHPLPGEPA